MLCTVYVYTVVSSCTKSKHALIKYTVHLHFLGQLAAHPDWLYHRERKNQLDWPTCF